MKPYRILRSFPGNQTGNGPTENFVEGTVVKLSDHLAEVVLKEGWVEPVDAPAAAPATEPAPKEVDEGNPEARETKVTGPAETKPFDITTLTKKQLVTFAKDNFGLELDEGQKKDALLAAIAQAAEVKKQAE